MKKRCKKCQEVKLAHEFYRNPGTLDGHISACRDCVAAQARRAKAEGVRRKPTPAQNRSARDRGIALYPERYAARRRVARAIAKGRLKRAAEFSCVDCGEQATAYDHHLGYDPSHVFDIEPVCNRCHGLRSRTRGEHVGITHARRRCSMCGATDHDVRLCEATRDLAPPKA